MLDLIASTLVTYASISLFGVGALAASALTGPARLALVAMALFMVAAQQKASNDPWL